MYRRVIRPISVFISLFILIIPAVIFYSSFMQNSERSWYYFYWNDATQGIAAMSVAQRLGAPIEDVVCPGVTINMPYLYGAMLFRAEPVVFGNVEKTKQLLASAVFLHYKMSLFMGVMFIWVFYILARRLTEHNWLALAVALLLATNQWYVQQITSVRPELPSLLFVSLAALFVVGKRKSRPVFGPLCFGLFIALALFSKIQVLPVAGVLVGSYFLLRRDVFTQGISRICAVACAFPIVWLAALASFGFLKSAWIASATRMLTLYPPNAGICMQIFCGLLLLLLFAGAASKRDDIRAVSWQALLMIAGGLLALGMATFPSFYFGGLNNFIASVNTLLFGMVSYGRYGLSIWSDKIQYFGFNQEIADYLSSFAEFQYNSKIPLLYNVNLALVCALIVLMRILIVKTDWIRKKFRNRQVEFDKLFAFNNLAVGFLYFAMFFDLLLTARVPVRGGSPYNFCLHIRICGLIQVQEVYREYDRARFPAHERI